MMVWLYLEEIYEVPMGLINLDLVQSIDYEYTEECNCYYLELIFNDGRKLKIFITEDDKYIVDTFKKLISEIFRCIKLGQNFLLNDQIFNAIYSQVKEEELKKKGKCLDCEIEIKNNRGSLHIDLCLNCENLRFKKIKY